METNNIWSLKGNSDFDIDEFEISESRKKLDELFEYNQGDILHNIQMQLKEDLDAGALRDTVRHMKTPEEFEQIEKSTDPRKLENIPSDQGLGSISSKKNNTIKRGGKMIAKLFKLAHTLDKKGEYELANEVDKIIKELSQRAGLTPEEMVSLANELDKDGETELADKLDAMLTNK